VTDLAALGKRLEALGKRIVACKHFRPMRGMRDLQGRTWDEALLWRWSNEFDVPDLSDPATLGCVLAMVRAAYGTPLVEFEGETSPAVLYVTNWSGRFYIRRDCGDGDETLYADGSWSQNRRRDIENVVGDSEAEALVAALEAAP